MVILLRNMILPAPFIFFFFSAENITCLGKLQVYIFPTERVLPLGLLLQFNI